MADQTILARLLYNVHCSIAYHTRCAAITLSTFHYYVHTRQTIHSAVRHMSEKCITGQHKPYF